MRLLFDQDYVTKVYGKEQRRLGKIETTVEMCQDFGASIGSGTMKRIFMCAVLVMLSVSSAFGNATDDLLKVARYWKTEPELMQHFINLGARVNTKDDYGMTALMWAAWKNSNPEVVKVLIKAGANVNAKDKYVRTALMWAAFENSNPEVVKALIDGGADVNAKNKFGETALTYAKNDKVKRLILNAAKQHKKSHTTNNRKK